MSDWCVHYRGLLGAGGVKHETCDAGVVYASVQVAGAAFRDSLPCLSAHVKTCAMQRFPTAEESAEAERAAQERMEFMIAARRLIKSAQTYTGKKPPEDIVGHVECPKCKGRLSYSIARYNGHIWGRCHTAGCLSWME